VPPPPPQPLQPKVKVKQYGTRGVLELGGNFDFTYQYDTVAKATNLGLGIDLYAGYFVTNYFTVGLYFSTIFSQTQATETSWTATPGVLIAPGIAIRIVTRLFFYADLLGGFYVGRLESPNDPISGDRRLNSVYGAVGGEVGFKLRVGTNYLLRFGLRPIYHVGKGETEIGKFDIGLFNLLLRIGFSGFL